jgi:hypothetical protein
MNKFDIKQLLDDLIYSCFNFYTRTLFLFNFKLNKEIKKNIRYKNIHKNQRCFITGTGPSLKLLENHHIDFLSKEIVIAVNSFYKIEKTSKIVPKYYSLFDDLYWKKWSSTFSEIKNFYREECPSFITDIRAKIFVDDANNGDDSIYLYMKQFPARTIDSNINSNTYMAMNVVAQSILCAIYMGFKEIYLLGCDYNAFCNLGKGHAYDDEKEVSQSNYNLAFYLKYYWIGTEIHYKINELAKSRGVKIINITNGSLLDAYPKSFIDELL